MDDRQELNFHSSTEEHEVRIRDTIMYQGHATELPSIAPECSCHKNHQSELAEDQEMISKYAQQIRNNLHHQREYCPCKDVTEDYLKNG